MQRDFINFNAYLNSILLDDYGQEPDEGHIGWTREVMQKWMTNVTAKTVLDIGCGAACIAEPFFTALGMEYTGIALGIDVKKAQARGKHALLMDMSFLEFPDNSFDLIWCRHSLEHSPMPLLTLFEFHRVAKSWICVIVPTPAKYGRVGQNHYSVLENDQWEFLFDRSGWNVIWRDMSEPSEFRYMMEKKRP